MRLRAALSLLSLGLSVPMASGALWVPDEQPTIQAAVDATVAGDTILVRPGTYAGPGNHSIDFQGQDRVLIGVGGAELTVIDCLGAEYGFYLHSGESLASLVRGFTLQGASEAGIKCTHAAVTLDSLKFVVTRYTAIETAYDSLRVHEVEMMTPSGAWGFGIDPYQSVIEIDGLYTDGLNTAIFGGSSQLAFHRGEIYRSRSEGIVLGSGDSCVISGVDFIDNRGQDGGAINTLGPVTLSNCRFLGNYAWRFGGAIYVWTEHGDLQATDCLFSGNRSDYSAGAVLCHEEANADLVGCTVVGNTSDHGESGALAFGGYPATTGSITRCIIAFNTGSGIEAFDAAQLAIDCVDLFGNSAGEFQRDGSDQTAWADSLLRDPLFCGAAQGLFTLAADSPCLAENSPCGERIGAYAGGCAMPARTIRVPAEAPTIAAGLSLAAAGDTVLVSDGRYCEHDLILPAGVTLRSSAGRADAVTIDALAAGRGIACMGNASAARLEGITITGGSAEGQGGGVLLVSGALRIQDAVIAGNFAAEGGGIAVQAGALLELTGATLVANSATVAGSACGIFGGSALVERTLIALNMGVTAFACLGGGSLSFACSDEYGNAGGIGEEILFSAGAGDFSADPGFCDAGTEDWSLGQGSPCLPAESPCSLLVGALAQGCGEKTIRVPEDAPTIQAGITAAGIGDTVLVARGTYFERDIQLKSTIQLRSESCDPLLTIIDAQAKGRVLRGDSLAASTLISGFTIKNGYAEGKGETDDFGGGLYCMASQLTVRNCVFLENDAVYGGGIYAKSSIVLLEDCVLAGNAGTLLGEGGGLYAFGSAITAQRCQFLGNGTSLMAGYGGGVAVDHGGWHLVSRFEECRFAGNLASQGGGLFADDFSNEILLVDCDFEDNAARYGAGLRCHRASLAAESCRFRDNDAAFYGGGTDTWLGKVALRHCEISGNTAGHDGGGVYIGAAVGSEVVGCTIVGNRAAVGGGIYNFSSQGLTVQGCTIVANEAESGAGLQIGPYSLSLDGLLIAFNEGAAVSSEENEAVVITCSDVYGNTGGDWIGPIATQAHAQGNLSIDPRLCDLPGEDYSLAANSPCLPANNDCGMQIGAWGEGCAGTGSADAPLPARVALSSHPNPFNPSTTIRVELPAPELIQLDLYDLSGRHVARLLDTELRPAGIHAFTWDGRDGQRRELPSGVYFCRLTAGAQTRSLRLILLK